MQHSHINQILNLQHVTPACSELPWLPAGFKVLVLTFKTLDAGSLLKAHYSTAINGGIWEAALPDSKDCQQGNICQSHLGSSTHCTKLPDMLLELSFLNFKNLEKDHLRNGLSFLFYELILKGSMSVPYK